MTIITVAKICICGTKLYTNDQEKVDIDHSSLFNLPIPQQLKYRPFQLQKWLDTVNIAKIYTRVNINNAIRTAYTSE